MQIESRKEKDLIRIDRLSDEITSKFIEAVRLAGESVKSGNAAVVAAIECGKIMTKAKDLVGHGNWEKWLLDNCPDIAEITARRWMRLAKGSHVIDLKDCQSIRQAYLACGIIPRGGKKVKHLGTAEVDVFDCFVSEVTRLVDKIDGLDLSKVPTDRKDEIRTKLKEIEGKL